ncbi:MAG: NADH-quinone oxidoreductase subunit C [Nitrososphaerales archaeon]
MGLDEEIIEQLKAKLGALYKGEYWKRKKRLYVNIDSKGIVDATRLLIEKYGARLCAISVVEGSMDLDLIYHFALDHLEKNLHIHLKPTVPRDNPEIDSITPYTLQANWTEREIMELVGIKFRNHPDPRHIFLPYEWPEEPK